MKVTQLTVFLENRSGRLAEVTDILGKEGINIRGFSTTEAAEYGILRLIVPDPERAREILHKEGLTTHLTEVVCVGVPDEPGGLARVLDLLAEHEISVDYMYSITFNYICYNNPEADKLIEAGRLEFDQAKRAEIYKQYAILQAQDLPYIYAWSGIEHEGLNKSIGSTAEGGLVLDNPYFFWEIEKLTNIK